MAHHFLNATKANWRFFSTLKSPARETSLELDRQLEELTSVINTVASMTPEEVQKKMVDMFGVTKDDATHRTRFEGAWKVIKQELLDYITGEGMPKDAIEWYERNLEYNVPGGKLNRGMSVVDTLDDLGGTPLTDDEYLKAAVLGWGIELLHISKPSSSSQTT
ncbi:hypothetical protein EDD85DRAFT_954343 [Armillaria nabsnona]|nr:hypothetical protein EDD85DRAFT_954343 [Armillaria nabsnona]